MNQNKSTQLYKQNHKNTEHWIEAEVKSTATLWAADGAAQLGSQREREFLDICYNYNLLLLWTIE